MGPWWIFSMLIHLGFFAALFFLLPAAIRNLPSEDSPALSAASPEKVRQVAEDIRTRETESLRAKVNELQRLSEEMTALQKEALERLNELNQKNGEAPQKRLMDAQRRVVLAQEEAVQKLVVKDFNAVRAAQDRAAQAQTEALKALETQVSASVSTTAETRADQQESIQAQKEAGKAQEAALQASTAAAESAPGEPVSKTSTPIVQSGSAAFQAAFEKSKAAQTAALDSQKRASGKSAPAAPGRSEIDAAKTLPELYQTARRIEDALTASYQDARAAELAAIQHLPIEEARKLTETVRPVRPELDNQALTGDIADTAGLRKQEQQILTARKEVTGMLAQANNILNQVRPPEGGASITVESLQSRSKHAREMEAAALASEGTPARDLSGLMAKAGKGGGGVPQKPVTAGLSTSPAGPVPMAPRQFKSVPGRLILPGSAPVEKGKDGTWMFLDSWYLIGPWSNRDRRNLNTKFPPESIINLDAVYENESGKKLGWHFHQSGGEMIVPPGLGEYQIYYAFTELRSETECDRWIAVGSDDQSKVWVNDELVWKSSDILKGWNPGEGLRKIRLKQGINRILVRLENGHMAGGFSIITKIEN